jgi:hypothetical protein
MKQSQKRRLSRLHSKRADDAAWRASQAHVDADIEGLSRDMEVSCFVSGMKAAGVPVGERIKRLKAYVAAVRKSVGFR